MIQLTPRPCPPELTPELKAALVAQFLADKSKTPWKKPYIERELRLMSNDKCCYCECNIREESKWMEIEHFFAKFWHPEKVLDWENLLPACKRCNINKRDHNCAIEPIIHPVLNDPREHIKWRAYRLYDKTALGDKTIDVLFLNEWQRVVKPRIEVGKKIFEQLEKLKELTDDYQKGINVSTRRSNRIKVWFKAILAEALPKCAYAATAATVLLNDPKFKQIKYALTECGLWDDEMTQMEKAAQQITLDVF